MQNLIIYYTNKTNKKPKILPEAASRPIDGPGGETPPQSRNPICQLAKICKKSPDPKGSRLQFTVVADASPDNGLAYRAVGIFYNVDSLVSLAHTVAAKIVDALDF